MQASVIHWSAIRPFNSDFSETIAWIIRSRANFMGHYLSLQTFFFSFFQNFQFSDFYVLLSFSLTWEQIFQNAPSPTVSVRFQPNFIKTLTPPAVFFQSQPNFMRTYLAIMMEWPLLFLVIDQVLNILWHIEILKGVIQCTLQNFWC